MIQGFINKESVDDPFNGFDIKRIRRYKIITQNIPFVTHRLSILLIKSGNLRIEIQELVLNLIAGDIIIIPQNSICIQLDCSARLEIFVVSFTSRFALKNFIRKEIIGLLYCFMRRGSCHITLNETDFFVLIRIARLICIIRTKNNEIDKELQRIGIDFFLHELASVYSKYKTSENLCLSNKDNLILHFLVLLSNHRAKHHNINFYAESLCITAGYLNRIIKQKTGMTIKALIAEIIIEEAKKMLWEYNMPIVAISQELEFSNVSAFSTFFKKHTSISPSQYRLYRITEIK